MSPKSLTPVQEHVLTNLVPMVASSFARSYAGYVEQDDISQELAIWVFLHPKKLDEWVANHAEDSVSDRLVMTSLKNRARRFCSTQRQKTTGPPEDGFIYRTKDDMEIILEAMFAKPAALGPWTEVLVDMETAFTSLPDRDRDLLKDIHLSGFTFTELSAVLGVSPTTVSRRHERALLRLHDELGGHGPEVCADDCECKREGFVGDRRVVSNAHAQAVARNQYDD